MLFGKRRKLKHVMCREYNIVAHAYNILTKKRGLSPPLFKPSLPTNLGPLSNSALQGPLFQLASITYDPLKQS